MDEKFRINKLNKVQFSETKEDEITNIKEGTFVSIEPASSTSPESPWPFTLVTISEAVSIVDCFCLSIVKTSISF